MRYSSWKIDVLLSSLQEALCWMLRPYCELLHPGNRKFFSAHSSSQLHLSRLSVQMNSSSILHKRNFILGCLHLSHSGDLLYRDQAVLPQPGLLLLTGGFNNEQRGGIFRHTTITPWGNLLDHQFWSLKSTQATCCTAEVASSSSSSSTTDKSKAFVCQGGANCCSENDCCDQGKCKPSLTFISLFWKIEKIMIFFARHRLRLLWSKRCLLPREVDTLILTSLLLLGCDLQWVLWFKRATGIKIGCCELLCKLMWK